MQLDDGQRPRHEAGWDCLKIHIMQKIKNEIKEEVIMSIIIMKWSEAVFNVQYYKGLKAVWCYNVLNFLCLVVFEPPSGNCTRLPESLQNKIKKNEKIKKEGNTSNTRSLPVGVIVVSFVSFYCDVFYFEPVLLFCQLTTRLWAS